MLLTTLPPEVFAASAPPAKAVSFRTVYPEAMSPTTREQLRLADDAHHKMAAVMSLLACAARGETDAREAAWEALENLRGAFTAVADHLAAPDACALILGGQYQVGYTSGAAYSASFVRSLALSAWRLADEVALAQTGGAL